MLVKFVAGKLKHWDEFLDTCTFAFNTSVHESALFSPFEIMFGRKATLPIDLVMAKQDGAEKLQKCLETGGELSASDVERLAGHQQGIIEEAKINIKRAQEKQKEVYDRKHAHPHAFQVGSEVLKKDFRRKKQANGKLGARFLGPSPSKLIFDENAMRPHLVKCLQDGKFTMFPVRKRSRKGAMKATRKIPIYCVCRMPSVGGAAMIQCSNCQEWFHIHCVSPSPAALNTTSEPWYCTAHCD